MIYGRPQRMKVPIVDTRDGLIQIPYSSINNSNQILRRRSRRQLNSPHPPSPNLKLNPPIPLPRPPNPPRKRNPHPPPPPPRIPLRPSPHPNIHLPLPRPTAPIIPFLDQRNPTSYLIRPHETETRRLEIVAFAHGGGVGAPAGEEALLVVEG